MVGKGANHFAAPWRLEPPALDKLMAKIRSAGMSLAEFAGVGPW